MRSRSSVSTPLSHVTCHLLVPRIKLVVLDYDLQPDSLWQAYSVKTDAISARKSR